jgi:hypothetical protein
MRSKHIRVGIGGLLTFVGVVFFVLPGSMFLLILGLMMLSYDFPTAKHYLRICQRAMSKSARKLDSFLLNRKLRRNN